MVESCLYFAVGGAADRRHCGGQECTIEVVTSSNTERSNSLGASLALALQPDRWALTRPVTVTIPLLVTVTQTLRPSDARVRRVRLAGVPVPMSQLDSRWAGGSGRVTVGITK